MKTLSALLSVALITGLLPTRAMEAEEAPNSQLLEAAPTIDITQPQTTDSSLFPVAPATPAPAPGSETTTPEPTPLPAPDATAATTPAVEKKGSAEQLRETIRIRELKTQALEDPQVQAEKAKARQTKTEEGRRVLMRNYFTLLYTKMEQLDPALKEPLEKELAGNLLRFEQHNVYPSTLIENVTPLPGSCSADHLAPGTTPGTNPDATSKHSKKKKKKKTLLDS
jgi:hypothetical protein